MKNPFSFLFTELSSTSHPTGLSKHPYLEKNNVQTFNYSVLYVSLCSDSHRAVACFCSGGLKLNFHDNTNNNTQFSFNPNRVGSAPSAAR